MVDTRHGGYPAAGAAAALDSRARDYGIRLALSRSCGDRRKSPRWCSGVATWTVIRRSGGAIAAARRARLLAIYRLRLRCEDLEDCYSQATLELITRTRRTPFE